MTVNREVRERGKRFGVWACRRVGAETYRRAGGNVLAGRRAGLSTGRAVSVRSGVQ